MLAVLFEVTPQPGRSQRYFDIAAELRPVLERIEGFVSVERFQSLSRPEVSLSLSYWESEEAIAMAFHGVAWLANAATRGGEARGLVNS